MSSSTLEKTKTTVQDMIRQDHQDYSFFPFRSLIKLRWMTLLGQISAVLLLISLDIDIPLFPLCSALVLSCLINLIFQIFTTEITLSQRTLPYFLLYDLVQLGVLLYFTGGLFNPFVVFILGPLLISSSFNDKRLLTLTLMAGSMTVAVLYVSPYPLPWYDGGIILPHFMRLAIALALWLSIIFYGSYVFYVHHMKQSLLEKLSKANDMLFHQKQFSELGLLAVASAHELGTPIGTIMLTAQEIKEHLSEAKEINKDLLFADATLIHEQTRRCQQILKKLSRDYQNSGTFFVPFKNFLKSIIQKYPSHKKIVFEGDFTGDINASFELSLAFGNLIQNALRFANNKVTLSMTREQSINLVKIHDDGPGFSAKALESLGNTISPQTTQKHLGIGLYIAKNLFVQNGMTLSFKNEGGALCEVTIPTKMFHFQEAA